MGMCVYEVLRSNDKYCLKVAEWELQNLMTDEPAGRTILCHILLLCNYVISLWICSRRQ